MKHIHIFVLILLSTFASSALTETTTVYKVVNPDGTISFSDQPDPNASEIEVQPVSTVPAFVAPSAPTQTDSATPSNTSKAQYSITILSPTNGQAFHSANGSVSVETEISPQLANGYLIRALIDGSPVSTSISTSFQINNVNRGTHSLTVEILNPELKPISSASSAFTIHRPSKLN